MSRSFTLPDIGEGIHEAEIQEVLVAEGEEVEAEQTILRVETDKAAVDIPSPFQGTVEEIMVQTGDIVEVGDPLISFSGKAEEVDLEEPVEEAEEEKKEPEAKESRPAEKQEKEEAPKEAEKEEKEEERARKQPPQESGKPVPASPATRRLARELEVDLKQVPASGPAGRVTSEDVRAFAEGEVEAKAKAPAEKEEVSKEARLKRPSLVGLAGGELPPLPDFERWGQTERIPLRSVRRATARKMIQAWSLIPHVTHHDRADITELDRLRRQEKEEIEEGSLPLTLFVIKAVAAALQQYPRFNASLDLESQEIILKQYYHLGLAVDTERGLLVPVIRDVERKSMVDLAVEWPELVKRAQAGELSPEEMQGGTFTITNIGILGGTHFDPIINYPQVAILGMAQADWQPVVRTRDGERVIEPRYLLPLVVAFDHRVIDGADAARFMGTIKEALEDPNLLLLKI